jgi:tagatose 6-phosphate kinase
MILCIGATPALQRVMLFKSLKHGAVNRAMQTLDGIAGKSINVAKVLKVLGKDPLTAGFVGGDRGQELKREIEGRGVKTDFVIVPERTRQCITVIDQSAGKQTELVEESRPVNEISYSRLLAVVQRHAKNCKAMVMSGTLTPGAPEDFYLKCAKLGRKAGALVIVDAKGAPLMTALKASLHVVKPNRSELETTFGKPLKSDRDLKLAVRRLYSHGAKNVVVTNGSRPAVAFDGVDFWRIQPPRVKALNPIGSGDSFTAGLVWRLTQGESFAEACRWGAACGAANALTLMAGELNVAAVRRLAKQTRATKLPPI